MLPRTHVVPRPPACTELLTPAQSYQRPSSVASESNKSERSEQSKLGLRLQRSLGRGDGRPVYPIVPYHLFVRIETSVACASR